MEGLGLVFIASWFVSLALTRSMRYLARRCGAVDRPDGRRKLHQSPVPVWGGVAVYGAFLVGLVVACLLRTPEQSELPRLALLLGLSAGGIFTLGFCDDRWDLPGRIKLLLQFLCAAPLIVAGYWFDTIVLFNQPLVLGWLGVPLALIWLVGCVNALNLLDGMDGNASTVGAIAALAIAAIAGSQDHDSIVPLALALAGAILGFLVFNLPSASIYLGDAGSTTIGLVLAFLSLQGARESSGALRVAAPLVVLTIPLLDTTLAIIRRKLSGRRFDHADRGHIHHRLLERGLNPWQALGTVGILCLTSGVAATLATRWQSEPLAWLTSLILIVGLAQLRYFGHHEGRLVGQALRGVIARLGQRWQAATQSPAAEVSERTFAETTTALLEALQQWRCARCELIVQRGAAPSLHHAWNLPLVTEPGSYQWRIGLSFGSRYATRIELVAQGSDAESAEPRYLGEVAQVLRNFGRYWLENPERIGAAHLRLYHPDAAEGDSLRDAA